MVGYDLGAQVTSAPVTSKRWIKPRLRTFILPLPGVAGFLLIVTMLKKKHTGILGYQDIGIWGLGD
jgi:hypothetical protein